jgi:hypothetical protein
MWSLISMVVKQRMTHTFFVRRFNARALVSGILSLLAEKEMRWGEVRGANACF